MFDDEDHPVARLNEIAVSPQFGLKVCLPLFPGTRHPVEPPPSISPPSLGGRYRGGFLEDQRHRLFRLEWRAPTRTKTKNGALPPPGLKTRIISPAREHHSSRTRATDP